MNNSQRNEINSLVAGMQARGFSNVEYAIIDNASAQDVCPTRNYRVNVNSVCIQWTPESVGKIFPIIEVRPSGIPALPEISTYYEHGNKHGAYLSVSQYAGVTDWHELTTSHDNALFGDLHIGKVRKTRTVSRVSVPIVPATPIQEFNPEVAEYLAASKAQGEADSKAQLQANALATL